jgi:hypothetical protein
LAEKDGDLLIYKTARDESKEKEGKRVYKFKGKQLKLPGSSIATD